MTHIVADYQSRHVLALNHHQEVTGVGEYDAFGFRNRVGMAAAAVAKSQDVTGLGKLPVGGLDSDFRLRVGFIEAPAAPCTLCWPSASPGYVEVKDSLGTVLSTAVGQYPSIVSGWHSGAGFTASFNTGASSAPMHAVLQGFEYDRRNSYAKYFPPMRFPGQYYDEETDLHENWNRFYDPATGGYLSTEPLLQSPRYLRAMAHGGTSVPPYAYAASNPIRYTDRDGRKVTLTGIRSIADWTTAVSVNIRLKSCPAITDYFRKCFGSDPWSDSIDHEFVSSSDRNPGEPGRTNFWTQTTTLYGSAFGANTVAGEAELGATMVHELSHQMSLTTFDGQVRLGLSEPTGRCTANAFERLARCVLSNGCSACSTDQCETPGGVTFGPGMSQ